MWRHFRRLKVTYHGIYEIYGRNRDLRKCLHIALLLGSSMGYSMEYIVRTNFMMREQT